MIFLALVLHPWCKQTPGQARLSCFVLFPYQVQIFPHLDALNGAEVKVLKRAQLEMEVSKSSEEEETLTGFLNQGVNVTGP